jgi:hypothetical protein
MAQTGAVPAHLTLELLASLLAPPATTATDTSASGRQSLAAALAAELGASLVAAAPACLDEATAATASTAAQWLAGTLRQSRAPPVLEAWHDAVPLLVSSAAACASDAGVGARAPVRAALLLHDASGHPSPLVRRLALVSHLALAQRCLSDGASATAATAVVASLLACTFVRATAEPCDVPAATPAVARAPLKKVAAVVNTTTAAPTIVPPVAVAPLLHDDASLVDATATLLHSLLSSHCEEVDGRLAVLHGVMLACVTSGSAVLSLAGLDAEAEADVEGAHPPTASAAVTAAVASARASGTGLAPLSLPSAALLAGLFDRLRKSSALTQAASSCGDGGPAVLCQARRLSALAALLRSQVLPRLSPTAPLPLALQAVAPAHLQRVEAAGSARFGVAAAVCSALLSGPLTALLAAVSPLGESAALCDRLLLTLGSLVAAPLSPPVALARAVAFGADCAPPSGSETARATENAAWLQFVCGWAGSLPQPLCRLLLQTPSVHARAAPPPAESLPLLMAVAAAAGVTDVPQLHAYARSAPLAALAQLVRTLAQLHDRSVSDAVTEALASVLSARLLQLAGQQGGGGGGGSDGECAGAAAAEPRLWLGHMQRDTIPSDGGLHAHSPPVAACVTLSGALATAAHPAAAGSGALFGDAGDATVFDVAQPHAWAHAAGRLAAGTATAGDVSALLTSAVALASDPRAASAAADASAVALAAASASGTALDAGSVPLYTMLAALAQCVGAMVAPMAGLLPLSPSDQPQLSAALLGAARIVCALPSGAVRIAGLRALSGALFSGHLWARLAAAAEPSSGHDTQRAACGTAAGLLRAADAALSAVIGDDDGVGTPGCDAAVGAFASCVVPTLQWLVTAAEDCSRNDGGGNAGALALLRQLTAPSLDHADQSPAPPLLSLLQRLVLCGEHVSGVRTTHAAIDASEELADSPRQPAAFTTFDDATPTAVVRAAAAGVLARAFVAVACAGGDSTLLPSPQSAQPAPLSLNAFLPVGLLAEAVAAARAATRPAPRPGIPAVTRLMRQWQAAAALLTSAVCSMGSQSAAACTAIGRCLREAGALFDAAAAAPLPGCVRQYVEVAFGAWLAAVSSPRAGGAGHGPGAPSAGSLADALYRAVAGGAVPPTPDHDRRASFVPFGWSNATLLLTALTVAHELLPLTTMVLPPTAGDCGDVVDEAAAASRTGGQFAHQPTHALAPSLLRTLELVALVAATCQRTGVREAAQCCLLRLTPRPPGGGGDGRAYLNPLLAAVLSSLECDVEVRRTAACQPTVLRPETGVLLRHGSDAAMAALLYSLLPVDDGIAASEAAAPAPVVMRLVPGAPGHWDCASRAAVAGVSQGIATRLAARQEEAQRQLRYHRHRHAGDDEEDEAGDASDGNGDDTESTTRTSGRSLRRAQAAAAHVYRAVVTSRTPPSALAAALPRLHLRQSKAGGSVAVTTGADAAPPPPPPGRAGLVRHRLTLVASLLRKPTNLGAVLRAAEALAPRDADGDGGGGLTVTTAVPLSSLLADADVTRASVGASKRLADAGALRLVTPHALPAFLDAAARGGARVVALELTTGSVPLPDYRFLAATAAAAEESDARQQSQRPQQQHHTVLLLGDEVDGVPAALLGGGAVSAAVAIPQSGATASLNVASAAAVALYELARQLRA